jgi:hypothetical protein
MANKKGFLYLIARVITPGTRIFSCLIIIITGIVLLTSYNAGADTAITAGPGQSVGNSLSKGSVVGHEQAARFYQALERLIEAYGEDHSLWPDNGDKRLIQDFLEKKDALTLSNCVFARNLLGLGIGETTKDAEEALRKGVTDAWGHPYSLILAGGKDAPKLFEVLYAIAINRGAPLFNRDISAKVFVSLKADLHSLFADVFKNFNGEAVLIMAREIHIMGAPGSTEPGYGEKLNPALCAADSLYATVYIGEDDPVTTIIPKSFREKMYSFFGLELPDIKGKARISDECVNKGPPAVKVVQLKTCIHDIPEYYPGMRKYGTTLLQRKDTVP